MKGIREKRAQMGVTQVQLAALAGMDPATLNRIEQGKANPNLKTIERLADALEVEVADFFPKAQSPLPLEGRHRAPGIKAGNAYFVPLEEGEEEDVVTLRIYYVQLLEGNEPVLRAMREASPEEAAKMRRQREKAGRTRE